MMRRIAIASVLLAAGCASQQQAQKGSTTTEERMRITNQHPFDVSVCQPRSLSLPQPLNQNILLGAISAARPEVMECLVDPKSRGTAETTQVVVKTSVTDQGGTHAISGENLTAEGQACIQKALDTRVPLTALPAGAQPVQSESSFIHELNNSPAVKLGLNPGSDFSGAVRLGQPTWCDCYAGFTSKIPPLLKANVDLKKGMATAADITFDPVGTPEGDQLAACLKGKMVALPAKLEAEQLKFSYRFVHLNSQAPELAADLPPEQRFFQLELVRNQRTADAAIAFGTRSNAAEVYDAIVSKYQKTKDWKLVDELKARCAVLVEATQSMVNAIDAQLKVDQSSLAIAQELKAKDESWADVETKLQVIINATQQDLNNAQKRLADDKSICPKERK
ncbi:hypothetical protein [Archangium lipolyticum]|uniref:hypothetical protein n=1 Tax=Archangium lipolyticum TaxID=2970465 RepID=UPI002149F8FB|nr:hypothetical protein [Archangium lipolyticum]